MRLDLLIWFVRLKFGLIVQFAGYQSNGAKQACSCKCKLLSAETSQSGCDRSNCRESLDLRPNGRGANLSFSAAFPPPCNFFPCHSRTPLNITPQDPTRRRFPDGHHNYEDCESSSHPSRLPPPSRRNRSRLPDSGRPMAGPRRRPQARRLPSRPPRVGHPPLGGPGPRPGASARS